MLPLQEVYGIMVAVKPLQAKTMIDSTFFASFVLTDWNQ